jgi:hypothetical protein
MYLLCRDRVLTSDETIEPPPPPRIGMGGSFATSKGENRMKSTRLMMGAAVTGCIVAATVSGVSAQEHGNLNGRANARVQGSHVGASGQVNGTTRQGMNQGVNRDTNGRQANMTAREHRGFAEGNYNSQRRVATENGYNRQPRDRREFGRTATQGDGTLRRDRWGYGGPGRDVGVDGGVAAGGYAVQPGSYGYADPVYGYSYAAPAYGYGYAAPGYRPLYGYAPSYGVYDPVAPYYDYAPGVGIGIGPIGIGIGPAWGW